MTKSLPSSPVRAAAGAVLGPYGTGYPAPRRTLMSVGGRRHTPSSSAPLAAPRAPSTCLLSLDPSPALP